LALQEQAPLLLGGAVALATGAVLLFDDVGDFGEVDRPHHWQWGILLILLAVVVIAIGLTLVIAKLIYGG